MPDITRLWNNADIAEYLGIADKVVFHHIAGDPTFPRPVKLPNGRGGTHHSRWKPADIIAWVDRYYEQPDLD